jgi:CRP-like cAMP-binding protein
MEEFLNFLNKYIKLNQEEMNLLSESLRVLNFSKKEVIQKAGDTANKFYFNVKGFVRMYYVVDGVEKTAYFYPQNTFVSDFESYVKETPTEINFQALEDTILIELTKEKANQGLELSKNLQKLAIIMMEQEMIVAQQIIKSFITESPEQRYLKLIEDSPEIIQKAQNQHIASYLQITPESLSRLKHKLYSNS